MNSGPILTIGSTGVDVRRLQTILVMTKLLDYTGIDGNFGPKTQDAVKSFQQASNLSPDGIVGQATWNALPADPNTPHLARGSTGAAVSALQKGLLAFGGGNSATDPGPIDGQFGPKTEFCCARLSNPAWFGWGWDRRGSDVVGARRRGGRDTRFISRSSHGLGGNQGQRALALVAPGTAAAQYLAIGGAGASQSNL